MSNDIKVYKQINIKVFDVISDILSLIELEDEIHFIKEEDDQHLHSSLAVISSKGKIGYVDKDTEKELNKYMNSQMDVLTKVSKITGGKDELYECELLTRVVKVIDDVENKWYTNNLIIILFLFLFFPIGLYLMWKYSNWDKIIKIIVTIFIAFLSFRTLQ